MVAAGKGRLSDVSTLLSNGADAGVPSRDGSTAAQWAQKMGYPQVAEVIRAHSEVRTPLEMQQPKPLVQQ